MKKQLLLLTLLFSTAINAFADEVEIGGLWYEVITNAKEAKVIQYKNYIYYSGSIVIPKSVEYNGVTCSVTSIGEMAFYGCLKLTSVTIGNSVTSIGRYAFCNCSKLTSVTIPNSVTSIGYQAFDSCFGLTSITIPNSVTSIGSYAFEYCSGLTSVTIPNSVTSIGEGAFSGCSGLTSVSVDAGNTVYDSRDNCNAIIETASNTLITGCKSTIIPNSVTSIGSNAFNGCYSLTSVTIPNSVTIIGSYAFEYCSGLTSVTIPNSVTSIGSYAFLGCTGLTSVSVDAGNTVYDSRDNCNAIIETASNKLITGCKSTIIPNSVKSIGSNAFNGCYSLTSVTIPNSVKSIGSGAFRGCSGLISVTIPNSVTSIGEFAFHDCSALTSVTIGNSVTSIGNGAFYNCSNLISVTIGNGIKNIGSKAFAYCTKLTDVYCYAKSVPSTPSNAFTDSAIEYATLHVPTASIDAYKSAAPWSGFNTMSGRKIALASLPDC